MTDNLIPDVNPNIPIKVMLGGGRARKTMQKGGTTPQDIQILRKFHMGEGQELDEVIDEPTKQEFLKQRKRCMKNSGTKTVLDKNCWAVSRVLRELLLKDIRAENSKTDVIRVHVKPQQSIAIHVIGDDIEYEELEDDDEPAVVGTSVGTSTAEGSNAEDSNAEGSNAEGSNAEGSNAEDSNAEGSNAEGSNAGSNSDSEASDPRRKSSAATTGDIAQAANEALAAANIGELEGLAYDVPEGQVIVENPLRDITVPSPAESANVPPPVPAPAPTPTPEGPTIVENPLRDITVPSPAATAEVPPPVPVPAPAPEGPTVVENPLRAISTAATTPSVPPPPVPAPTVVVKNPIRNITPKNKKSSNNGTKRVRINNQPRNNTRKIVRNPLVNLGVVQTRNKSQNAKPKYTIGSPTLIKMESSNLQSKLDSAKPTIQSLESKLQTLNKSITNINHTLGNPRIGSKLKNSLTQTRKLAVQTRKNMNTQLGKLKSTVDAAKQKASLSGENARVAFNPLAVTRKKGIPGAGTGLKQSMNQTAEIEKILTRPLGKQPSNDEVNALLAAHNGGSKTKRASHRRRR